ncbi:MAG: 4,5-DOPA dioxygenase extradiol [Flavobacteriaceae bacterium]|jgi:4,5-DOPA dioxygenase extradiol|nr:4,5-DOPA dioxygenase extradiol [Flavobacteriaceae bacterium]
MNAKMPVLFIGHGSPMNALEDNEFVQNWKKTVKNFPKPEAILCISAHWESEGTFVTAMQKPRTIHDFHGFPDELSAVQYPACGSPKWAKEIQKTVHSTDIQLDYVWGLDHGCWTVLKHLYSQIDVPVLQLSLDFTQNVEYHFNLAKELSPLREKGVLIIGSGNLVHNLSALDWNFPQKSCDWAKEANKKIKNKILIQDYEFLFNYHKAGQEILHAIPSAEHFLPAIYALAQKEENEQLHFFNDKVIFGSMSMLSFVIN